MIIGGSVAIGQRGVLRGLPGCGCSVGCHGREYILVAAVVCRDGGKQGLQLLQCEVRIHPELDIGFGNKLQDRAEPGDRSFDRSTVRCAIEPWRRVVMPSHNEIADGVQQEFVELGPPIAIVIHYRCIRRVF